MGLFGGYVRGIMVNVIFRGGEQSVLASQGEYALDSNGDYAVDSNGETALGVE